MCDFQLTTPIAFIIFNRPDATERVFAEIAKAKPPKLLVVGDGARISREGEAAKVAATRAIIDRVDWPCEVVTNFSDLNLGCKIRVSSGLDWVFEQVEEAIILEDDCLPSASFFRFCEEMLIKYKFDNRIWHIDGTNFQEGGLNYDYDFSRYPLIWGWASWRRAWKFYDVEMKSFDEFVATKKLELIWPSIPVQRFWMKNFRDVRNGSLDTWDYQWIYSIWSNGGLAIRPNINMIKNIGFSQDATHTTKTNPLFNSMVAENISWPIRHPTFIIHNHIYDEQCSKIRFNIHSLIFSISLKILLKIKCYLKN